MNDLHRFDLICFDWDGTLFDSTAIIARCIQEAVVDVGGARPSAQDAAFVIGLSLGPALARVAPDIPREKYVALGARYREHYLAHQNDISLFAGVLPLIRELRQKGCHLAVATGKSRRGLDEVLTSRALSGLFDGSRTADETAGKPNPRMLLELMREFGAPPERTLMIGDTSHDLEMARNAGCASVGVSYGAHRSEDLDALGALFVARSVPDLRAWLEARV
ncbi:MAG: HAD-IIIA family hydrolase [Burkholderiaceae bacterium]|nr:MAG: HAD-IIIA family hydrolase [Burkholderiaceae bacterium]